MKYIQHQYKVLTLLFFLTGITFAQEVYVGSGFTSASFEEYENSEGENTLNNTGYTKPLDLMFESGFRFNLYRDRVKLDAGFTYNKYQINTSFYSGNIRIPTTYNLSYLGLKAGINISVIEWKRLKLQLHSHFSHDWLIFGTNEYRDVFVNIYKDKTLDRTLVSFHRGIGMEFEINDTISAYLRYNIKTSFRENNQDDVNGEKYALRANSFGVGLIFDLSKTIKKQNN